MIVNYHIGIRQALQHLVMLGHRAIAFIGESSGSQVAQSKKQAFQKCLSEIGCASNREWMIDTGDSDRARMEAVKKLLAAVHRPTALICSNRKSSFCAVRTLQELGITVPGEMSLIGFDVGRLQGPMGPKITSIQTPLSDIASAAVRELDDLINASQESSSASAIETDTYLVRGESTGFPRGRRLPKQVNRLIHS